MKVVGSISSCMYAINRDIFISFRKKEEQETTKQLFIKYNFFEKMMKYLLVLMFIACFVISTVAPKGRK